MGEEKGGSAVGASRRPAPSSAALWRHGYIGSSPAIFCLPLITGCPGDRHPKFLYKGQLKQ